VDGQQEQIQELAESQPPYDRQPFFRRLEGHIGRRLLSGFVVLVPLIVTYVILRVGFVFVDENVRPFFEGTPLDFPGIGVIITLAILYVIGAFFAGKRFQSWLDSVWTAIPVVKNIYGVARQSIDLLAAPTGHRFSRVVFVEWPRPGVKALGFVTGHIRVGQDDGSRLVVVYIPTVPNPTSGNLAWVGEDDIIETDYSVEEAMKAVFSGGIVLPEMPATHSIKKLPIAEE
jgi:uncharacterized membrane protein